jgi:hypothetical protein
MTPDRRGAAFWASRADYEQLRPHVSGTFKADFGGISLKPARTRARCRDPYRTGCSARWNLRTDARRHERIFGVRRAPTHGVQSLHVRDLSIPDRQPRPGTSLQALPSQIRQSLTCSNRAMDDGDLANDLPDWWPYPVRCGHGHPWSPGHVIVSYLPCPCRTDEGISGHTVVHCTTDACRSAWYRPRHYPPDATPSHAAGEPGGEPPSPDAGRPRAY